MSFTATSLCFIATCKKVLRKYQWILIDNFRKEIPLVPWRTFTRRTKRERTFQVEDKPKAEVEVEVMSTGKSKRQKGQSESKRAE